jgi:nitroreductase
MPLDEAMFTQRSIRRFRPDPIPVEDRALIRQFGPLYKEAWWAKRHDQFGWTRPEDIPADQTNYQSAVRLAEEMQDAPLVIFVMALPPGNPLSVVPAAQNLMLATRGLGIGSIPTACIPQ